MKSQIFKVELYHSRLRPVRHDFRYQLHFYAFDLDELCQLDQRYWFFGHNRRRPLSIHDEDYLGPGEGNLKARLLGQFSDRPWCSEVNRVSLVTAPRLLGYAFNPVSFFYCHNKEDELLGVVAEVNNTFGERHRYILDRPLAGSDASRGRYQARKRFYVSPFNDRQGWYDFRLSDLGSRLEIEIDLLIDGELTMSTGFSGPGQPLTARAFMKALLQDPLGAFLTLPRIHWQAAKLYFGKKLGLKKRPLPANGTQVVRSTPFQKLAQRAVLSALAKAHHGSLRVRLPDGSELTAGDGNETDRAATLTIKSPQFFTRVLLSGDIAFGEAYTDGLIEADDMTRVLQFFLANRQSGVDENHPWLTRFSHWVGNLYHWSRRNTLAGSRKNISAHYDLSNDLFESFLDSSMTYSSALFREAGESLSQAQMNKLDSMLDQARVGPQDHLLEIGCGWGSLAIRAARTRGCRVSGVTLSREQLDFADERIEDLGLNSLIDLHLCDYRQLEGQYDAIVSIEMLEAVGRENFPTFFQTVERLLKPGGTAVIQVITMADEHYEAYLRRCDWIQRYIFPGGCLASAGDLRATVVANTELKMGDVMAFGQDYADTLDLWQRRFNQNPERIKSLGFDDRFIRLWNYYFSYCKAGFRSGPLDVIQFALHKAPVQHDTVQHWS